MRITPRREQDCPWYLRPFFWNQRRKYGKPLDASLLWARSPKLFLGVAFLYGMTDRSSAAASVLPDAAGRGRPSSVLTLCANATASSMS